MGSVCWFMDPPPPQEKEKKIVCVFPYFIYVYIFFCLSIYHLSFWGTYLFAFLFFDIFQSLLKNNKKNEKSAKNQKRKNRHSDSQTWTTTLTNHIFFCLFVLKDHERYSRKVPTPKFVSDRKTKAFDPKIFV